jgi:hypothetical protein
MRSVSPWLVLAAFLLVAAIACGVIAATTWNDWEIEGAYLNRSVGAPSYAGVFSTDGDLDRPRILLGAAIGLALSGVLVVAVFATLRRRARRRAPAPPEPARGPGR